VRAHARVITIAVALAATALAFSIALRSPAAGHLSSASFQQAGSAAPGALSPDLSRLSVAHPGRRVVVIIQFNRGIDAARGRALVRSLGGRPGLDLHIINGMSATMTAGAARRLAGSGMVHAVSLNARVAESTLTNFNPQKLGTVFNQNVQAPKMWNVSTGKGVGVAVLDTGIDGDLPDFQTSQNSNTSRVIASVAVDPGAATMSDTYGHGTDVAGLIAGNGGYLDPSDPNWGRYAGSAPDANLIEVKISDEQGSSTLLDAIYGLQFIVDNQANYNIKVVNLSFRSLAAQSYLTDPLDAAVEQAWFAGITVVAAAGNLGTESDAVSYAPGNDPYVITVGAADDLGTKSSGNDVQTTWSSQGVTEDGFTKPDVLAPGAHIVSVLAPNSAFATLCPQCIVNNNYFQASGTSMAAPIVAGAVADLLALHPDWTPSMVKGAIVNTALPLIGGGNLLQVVNASAASGSQLSSDQNLTPNSLLDSTGSIDYTQAAWSRASWTGATDPLRSSWTSEDWTCQCSSTTTSGVDPTRGSWTSLGWATKLG
jgi:serine protease AprX